MVRDQAVNGMAAQALAAKTPSFGPGLDDVSWADRVEV